MAHDPREHDLERQVSEQTALLREALHDLIGECQHLHGVLVRAYLEGRARAAFDELAGEDGTPAH